MLNKRSACAATIASMIAMTTGIGIAQEKSRGAFPLYEWEAKTLVFLAPVVQENAAKGLAVKFGLEHGPGFNHEAFFVFRAMVETDSPSNLIGTLAVNKHTAEVQDVDLGIVITSPDLKPVQAVLRKVHKIGTHTIEQYGDIKVSRE